MSWEFEDGLTNTITGATESAGRLRPPARDIPAQSPSVAIAGKARSHGRGSYQVGAHDPVAGGQDSAAAVAVLTAVAMLMASVA